MLQIQRFFAAIVDPLIRVIDVPSCLIPHLLGFHCVDLVNYVTSLRPALSYLMLISPERDAFLKGPQQKE